MNSRVERWQPVCLSLFRFITGLLLFQYGVAKHLKFPAGSPFAKTEMLSLAGVAGALELVLGALLMIGLFTRGSTFLLSGLMAFAYFLGHYPRGFYPVINGGPAAILFCFAFLYLFTAGGGPLSVDAWLDRKTSHSETVTP
jgi:putative oxidoreductase